MNEEFLETFLYKIVKSQFLSQSMMEKKEKRNDRTCELLNKHKHPLQPNMFWFFSDEKCFYQHQMGNLQNNHWFSLSSQNVRILMKTKHRAHIIVVGVVSGDDDLMPSFIFPYDFTLNIDTYIKCLLTVVAGKLMSGNRNFRHALQTRQPRLGYDNLISNIVI